jgi:tRNA-splicing ligase RtcB
MNRIDVDGGVPILSWATDLEPGALAQAQNLARLPFAFRNVSLMPDAHQGYGMPIGGVLAAVGVVVPNAVGVDIGCGMLAARTTLRAEELPRERLAAVLGEVRKRVPVGFAKHAEPCEWHDVTRLLDGLDWDKLLIVSAGWDAVPAQLGTLGGGNHFIEIQADDAGAVWVMIHSGSRNVGKQVADYYNRQAQALNERYWSRVPSDWDLAFIPLDEQDGQTYIQEMNFCVRFALANRQRMAAVVLAALGVEAAEVINIAHNYAAEEVHDGKKVWVHRKGATLAEDRLAGIIPGSQGSASYIVRGRGERQSFRSCSHGAGRRMGRKQAQRTLSLADEQARLDAQGILHSVRHASDLDEAPSAYKDIDAVMASQRDLVETVVRLRPLAVVKG